VILAKVMGRGVIDRADGLYSPILGPVCSGVRIMGNRLGRARDGLRTLCSGTIADSTNERYGPSSFCSLLRSPLVVADRSC
jgi:hypothetical protein